MKRSKIVFACVCACMVFAVLGGCKNAISSSKPVVNGNGGGGIPPAPGKPEAAPQTLLEFMFKEAIVIGLRGDIYGTIDEATKTVSVKMPSRLPGIDMTKLEASFKVVDGAKVFVGSTEQKSGVTKNNFSDSVIYTVKTKDGTEQNYTVKVKEAAEQLFSELPQDQQEEIKNLYGYYWANDGTRNECPAINAERLAVYGNGRMSMSFTNLRWSRVSSSMWECFSYAQNDTSYGEKRIIFTFVKDSNGTIKVYDVIMKMGPPPFGPYTKGKEPEKVVEGGKTYYRYNSKSPKLDEPRMQ